ncbi:Tn3 family transposase [Actinopolyspora mortivallis]|uniref:Tn3 family transposase n=1 Tax=Actinopolyspora mortivallis TaxID=33906 RepID=UPI00039E434B|nr:Tn3 family transposase [Actinopolyspora mortivallis]
MAILRARAGARSLTGGRDLARARGGTGHARKAPRRGIDADRHDPNFDRPDAATRYQHIDVLFDEHTIDWDLVERHWSDLLRSAISIREGRVSS